MSSSGRVDFLGIDNATLDFSQLEDYINDEEDPNESIFSHGHSYFNDNLVTADLKLPDSPRSANLKVSSGHLNIGNGNGGGGGRLIPGEAVQQSLVSSSQSVNKGSVGSMNRISNVTITTPSGPASVNPSGVRSSVQINQGSNLPIDHPSNPGANGNSVVGSDNGGEPENSQSIHHLSQIQANHQHLHHQHHHLSHHQAPHQQHHHSHPHHPHQQQQIQHSQPHHHLHHQQQQQHHHHQTISLFSKHLHHTPESPPDSGSEPPYSPPNDENRMNTSNQGNIGSTNANNTNQNSQQITNKMMQSGTIDSSKHFNHYSNNQIKHLQSPEIDLTLTQNHLQSQARNGTLNHINTLHNLGGQIQSHPDEGILSHLGSAMITGPINLQSPSIMSSPPSGQPHLTSLYSGANDDYIGGTNCGNGENIGEQGDVVITNGTQPNNQSNGDQTSSGTKKRRISESPKNVPNNQLINSNSMVHIKQEPGGMSPEPGNNGTVMVSMEEEYGFDYNTTTDGPPSVYLDSAYQCIRFQVFQQTAWHTLCDASLKELPVPNYRVDADKGFNFSNADDAFVCQKKNHFQVTVHVQPIGDPQFVKTPDAVRKVDNFYLHFYGVKVESPSQTIKVEQSQSDRSKKPFHPVLIELCPDQVSKTTVGRLHFSETTSNNMRKKGKPNPDQRYFYLVVSLCAHVGDQSYPIVSHASERIIVRASNPGQFENDMELSWQKGHTPESIYHAGRVGINTDRPDEPLVVHGNVKVTGHIIQPSDIRAKTNIEEISTREQLQNVANIRVVRYQFTPEFAQQVGLKDEDINGTGIIAQEIQKILPDAIKETGDVILPSGERIEKLLVVNKERIFMENVGAVKELCKVTDNLETRIDELERMNRKLRRINRFDSIKSILSSTSSITSASTVTCISNSGPNNKRLTCKLPHNYENQRRKCSKHASPEDNQVCTNRFMQSIIMILVLIMAFCLASIVTLYILDFPRRHTNQMDSPSHHKIDHQFSPQHNQFSINNNSHVSQSSLHHPSYSYSPSSPRPTHPSSPNFSTPPTISHFTVDIKKQIDQLSKSSSEAPSEFEKYPSDKTNPSNVQQQAGSKSTKPASIPILKPRVLGESKRCASTQTASSLCNTHCCMAYKSDEVIINNPLKDDSPDDSNPFLAPSSIDKPNYRSPKEIETDTKSKDMLELNEEEENRIKDQPLVPSSSSTQFSVELTTQSARSPSVTSQASSTVDISSLPAVISSTQNPKSPVTIPIKTAINNHVLEEVSSRANHGRYLNDIGPSSSVNNISPGIETGSHINNLAVDNSFNYSTIESNNSSSQSMDPIDQHIAAKVDRFSNDKFVSFNSHQPPSMLYSKAEEFREKRETREDRITRQDPRDKYQTGTNRLSDWVDSIKLIELNATIGREFCDTWQCVQQSGPLLTYLIPISKYMSHEYVTLQFSLSTALKVDNCEYSEPPISCPSLPPGSVPHSYHRPTEHLPVAEVHPSFRIPIGLYLRSSYIFRILSKERNAETPCSLPSNALGSSYLEIKLIFNRICEK
ncbi:uncharacterized protein LOC107371526 isoform X3 [Tetranychus urticae]|uniref:uncharacterized protein LOC107371526 isoform X3 n=1 Tax=Tetranychus urticae TaxID=32264 RepID=UPI00077BD656|nr:uncharacterized protein LOC107371526 isoform X3 [Tetranychus urticae]